MKKSSRRPSRFRLSPRIRPTEYDVHLEPDLANGTFAGRVRIAVALERPEAAIRLHAVDLKIDSGAAFRDGSEMRARVAAQPHDETIELRFRDRLPAGRSTLALRYHGRLGQHLRGLYAARSGERRYAFTQLEAADARRMMPCFDEPSFKARFRISVTAAEGETVISNGPLEREEVSVGGRTVHFAPTPPLSTYLLALAVGPLESSRVEQVGATTVRTWHVPGKGVLTEFGLEAAAAALRRLEDYFGIPYPYGKLDLVAVPDFEAGAMENAGAVFFRETLLLIDPATASLSERKRTAEVIAHELAHMWYGDLVTMAWWDDLWLNEAFATWMAYKVVDDWRSEWRMWQGYEHDRASALALDALANTHPIYARVRSVAEATENFDAITYEKGAAVVRMIEHYLGAEPFRDGVRLYMHRHREGNAVAADLWRALEEASGREVARVAQAWIEKPGFPLVRLGRRNGGLTVRQERFFADPRIPAAKRRSRWPLPLVVKHVVGSESPSFRRNPESRGLDPGSRRGDDIDRGDGGELERFLVDGASAKVRLARGADRSLLFGNAGAGGFYRVEHDESTRSALVSRLPETLSAVERMALVGDQWALVRAGKAAVESFLDVADALGEETDYDVLDGVGGPLGLIDEQVLAPESPVQARFRAWIARRFGPALLRLGWAAASGEDDPTRLRRAALVRLVGLIAEEPGILAEARLRLDEYVADRRSLEANLADAVVSLAARVGDETLYERYRGLVAEARTPHERRRFLLSLGSFRNRECVRRTLQAVLTSDIPTQDVAFVLVRLLANPAARLEA
ncbi:MAG: M1 family metallopeptidase, partial [Candidatus Binatia bacterium]